MEIIFVNLTKLTPFEQYLGRLRRQRSLAVAQNMS